MATDFLNIAQQQPAQRPVYDPASMNAIQQQVQSQQGVADDQLSQLAKILSQRTQQTPQQRANPFESILGKYGVKR